MEKQSGENKRNFWKNTLILFIGKFATQFMALLLLPIYTNYLLTEDFGTIDLIQTYISLFAPILIFRIESAIFRFLIDKRDDEEYKKTIITNSMCIFAVSIGIVALGYAITSIMFDVKYLVHIVINIISIMLSSILMQILRGLGKNKEYSISSIITAILMLILNILLIVVINCGGVAILISFTLANIMCCVYIMFNIKIYRYINFKKISTYQIKEILKYSFPMIPNTLSWWVINLSDRTIISIFMGSAINAIYTISCKFSSVLNSIYVIVNMAWSETASLHINDKNKDEFFSEMITNIYSMFNYISLLILVFVPFIFNFAIGKGYTDSYKYIPLLLYANTFNVLVGLIGGIYVAKKRTREIANTTICSAIINIVVNLIFVKYIGVYAACLSTILSYLVMSIYRYYDCQKYVKLTLNLNQIYVFNIIFWLSYNIYLLNNMALNIVNALIISIYIVRINRNKIKKISSSLFRKSSLL